MESIYLYVFILQSIIPCARYLVNYPKIHVNPLRTPAMTHYFEDLQVGSTFRVGEHTITKSEIIAFAKQFDPQPFHVDEEAAKESMFGELVASGVHTFCLSVRLFVTEFVDGKEGVANMGAYGMDDLQWHEPVRPGDTLRLQIEVIDKRPSSSYDDRGHVSFNRSVLTDDVKVFSVQSFNIVARNSADV